ncbi:ATP-dependent DNA helicase [Aphelenchoides besseyi]|nr:ATP-dependent DNA helicase [Aphelenchoides besseyi]
MRSVISEYRDLNQSQYLEEFAVKKQERNIVAFESDIKKIEAFPCNVCSRLFRERELRELKLKNVVIEVGKGHWNTFTKSAFQRDFKDSDPLEVCIECRQQLKKKEVPLLSKYNNFDTAEVPDELKDLNWLESILIKRVRLLQTTVLLTSTSGTHSGVIAAKGAMIHREVAIKETLEHIAETLPSNTNLNVIVKTSLSNPKKVKIVDMKKILIASGFDCCR